MSAAVAMQRLKDLMGRAEEHIDLAEAALVVALEEYPDLDIRAYLTRLDELADTLRRRLAPNPPVQEQLAALNHYLFVEQGFRPNPADYYDPRNSFLNDVLDRRARHPSYTFDRLHRDRAAGRAPAHRGVVPGALPCEVHGKWRRRRDRSVSGGISLSLAELRDRLKLLKGTEAPTEEQVAAMLGTASARDILVRMLRNLKAIYHNRDELARALSCSDRILLIAPDATDELRERATVYLELECYQAAMIDLERYLALEPDAKDAEEVREQLVELRRNAPRLN